MLIEISYGSREAFPLETGQRWTGERPVRVKLHPLTTRQHQLLKLSIIIFSLLSFSLLSASSPLLSLCLLQLCSALLFSPFLWQEILTIADQSFPPLQEAAGSGLAESECSSSSGSLSAASKQRMLLPTSKALLHT